MSPERQARNQDAEPKHFGALNIPAGYAKYPFINQIPYAMPCHAISMPCVMLVCYATEKKNKVLPTGKVR